MTTVQFERLAWDSEFFGMPIAKAVVKSSSPCTWDEIVTSAKQSPFNLVYVFSADSITGAPAPIDVKIDYAASLQGGREKDAHIREMNSADDDLYELAYRSGRLSRFFKDNNFEKGAAQRLYREWVDKSVSREIAHDVLVYETMHEKAGFITLGIKDGEARVGLLAVSERYGGRGIGTILMNEAKRRAMLRGCTTIRVATQQQNRAACNFYEKNGFAKTDNTFVYHLWI